MSTKDDELLRDLGYEQKMHREWSIVQNFGISFTIISVITGITTLFSYGLNTGGPAVMSLGWIVVCFFTSFVALGMAQITSAIPTAGGPYYWAAALAPPKHSAFVSWVTGYFNFLGQVAVTTGISFGCAGLITTLYTVSHPDAVITPAKNLGVYAAIMASHIILNCIGGKILIWLNNFSILLHSFGVASVAIAILAKAPKLQSAKFVFTTFNDNTNWSVRASKPYVAVIGLLISQYTITGFDASAHLAEETRNAARSSPIGVLMSVAISAVFGWFLMLSYLFAIQDLASVIDNPYGQPVLQIMIDSCGTRGGQALMSIVILCVWHCGLFSLTSNSRMAYAFARDKGIPSFFDHVSPRTGVPVRTIALMATLAFLLAVPSLGSSVAFAAATSIATSGLYISYAIPILVGLIYEKDFKKGPFNLGIMSRPVAFIAVAWVAFITIVFCLPSVTPVDSQTLNYTPVAIGIVLLWVLGSWFLFARKYFVGPINQVEKDLAHIPEAGGNADILEDAKKNAY